MSDGPPYPPALAPRAIKWLMLNAALCLLCIIPLHCTTTRVEMDTDGEVERRGGGLVVVVGGGGGGLKTVLLSAFYLSVAVKQKPSSLEPFGSFI